jgi:hypothetical protein
MRQEKETKGFQIRKIQAKLHLFGDNGIVYADYS